MDGNHKGGRGVQPPYRSTNLKSQRAEDPFDDSHHLKSPQLQSSSAHSRDVDLKRPSTARNGRSNSRSIIMARGAFSKSLSVFREKELTQVNQSSSNGDLFEYLIAPKDKGGQLNTSASSPMGKGSPIFTDNQGTSAFPQHTYDITRNKLHDSHSRGPSGSTNDIDSFEMESTYDDGFYTANEIQSMQHRREGTPPSSTVRYNEYHQSPSYSIRHDSRIVGSASVQQSSSDRQVQPYKSHQAPVLVAKGPGDNVTSRFRGSSTLSFTNTVPYNTMNSPESNVDQVGVLTGDKDSSPKKSKEKKAKKSKFSPNSTAVSAISENQLYSGLSDMHTGLFLSTYNGNRASLPRPKDANSTGFPTELPPRPAPRPPLPIRVTAEARAQFAARKQDERLALERRLAEPHLVRRTVSANNNWVVSFFQGLTSNCWAAFAVTQFGFLSTGVSVGVVVTLRSTASQSSTSNISVVVIWWLVLSVILLCVGGTTFGFMICRESAYHPRGGFRQHAGSREIVDGSIGRGDLESGHHGQRSFEMVPGANTMRREALSTFDAPQRVQNLHPEVLRPNVEISQRVRNYHHGFEQVPTYGTGEGRYYEPFRLNSPEVENYGYMLANPATPLTPLPQAVLKPVTSRNINDFPVHHYTPSKLSGSHSANPSLPDEAYGTMGVPSWTSIRSRDSLVAAAPHRDLAMKSLLGENAAPKTPSNTTDTWNRDQGTIESATPSQTSVYSYMPSAHPLHRTPAEMQQRQAVDTFVLSSHNASCISSRIDLDKAMPPTLKRVETEGPLEKLEKSLAHQSEQIVFGKQFSPPLDLGDRPLVVCHKRVVNGRFRQYGSREDNLEAGPAAASVSSSNNPRRRPEAIDHCTTPQAPRGGMLSRLNTGDSSALDNIDLTDSTFASRNPYRDSMNDSCDNSPCNMEILPATYYTGSGKGKSLAYE
ncbi:34ac2bf0-a7ce-4583-a1e6-b81fc05d7a11 [Sclerotinia trifoliorum]|uniref:34ac2bf0-a7ce-4583-a1e6-b81fc05d7a11 n=1 Tax=Sclerotinia trifoliorum TaxID=28548 RepID=A0A8H2VNG0_9HELO|nr:34ac2bf0-a7ce-4583-a1e6-b81fc05d7a11 [Sclerotinia trifoliorum]